MLINDGKKQAPTETALFPTSVLGTKSIRAFLIHDGHSHYLTCVGHIHDKNTDTGPMNPSLLLTMPLDLYRTTVLYWGVCHPHSLEKKILMANVELKSGWTATAFCILLAVRRETI